MNILKYLKKHNIHFLYHATFSNNVNSILKHGLGADVSSRTNCYDMSLHGYVYLAYSPSKAINFVENSENHDIDFESEEFEINFIEIPIANIDLTCLDFDENSGFDPLFDDISEACFQYKGIIHSSSFSRIDR